MLSENSDWKKSQLADSSVQGIKVHSILVSYFIHMRLNINGSIFCTKNKEIDFEEKRQVRNIHIYPPFCT